MPLLSGADLLWEIGTYSRHRLGRHKVGILPLSKIGYSLSCEVSLFDEETVWQKVALQTLRIISAEISNSHSSWSCTLFFGSLGVLKSLDNW